MFTCLLLEILQRILDNFFSKKRHFYLGSDPSAQSISIVQALSERMDAMGKQPFENLVHHLFQLAAQAEFKTLSDQQLLKRYADHRDELAFAELVRRYKDMIWRVCWRVLRHHQDVEDAFQATVMTLMRRAKTILNHDAIEGWLHRTALTVASNAKVARVRRRAREERSSTMRQYNYEGNESRRELSEVLDRELTHIPEKYRSPLLLCYLEGLPCTEAAQRLGMSVDVLEWRLREGRKRLKKRLSKYGMDWCPTMLPGGIGPDIQLPTAPPELVEKTLAMVRILALSNGAFETAGVSPQVALFVKGAMGLTLKAKFLLGVGLLSLVVLGAGAAKYSSVVHFLMGGQGQEREADPENNVPPERNVVKAPPRVDDYGDPLPQGALGRLGTVRFRHERVGTGRPSLVLIPAKGTTIIVDKFDDESTHTRHCPCFWDLSTGKPLAQLYDAEGKAIPVTPHMKLSLDGRLLADVRHPEAKRQDQEFHFWDMTTGKLLGIPAKGYLRCLAISPDGKTVAAVAGTELRVWDNIADKELWVKKCARRPENKKLHNGRVDFPIRLMYSSDGKTLLALYRERKQQKTLIAGFEESVRRWELATGKELPPWAIGIKEDDRLAWSMDGSMLAVVPVEHHPSASSDIAPIHLWDMITGKEVRQIHPDKAGQRIVAFSPDGKVLAVSCWGRSKQIGLWDTTTGKSLRHWDSYNPAEIMAFSPDGKMLVARCGHTLQVWDVTTGKQVNHVWLERGYRDTAHPVAFSSQGKTLVTSSITHEVRLWDVDPVAELDPFRRLKDPVKLQIKNDHGLSWSWLSAVSPDGKIVASFRAKVEGKSIKRMMTLWEVASGRELKSFCVPTVAIEQRIGIFSYLGEFSKFSPDGKVLAFCIRLGRPEEQIFFWEVATGKQFCAAPMKVVWEPNAELNFSPDGKTLSVTKRIYRDTQSKDKEFIFNIYDVSTGKKLFSLKESLASPEEREIAKRIHTWVFSPDKRTLATIADMEESGNRYRRIHLWNIHIYQHVVRLERPSRLFENTRTSAAQILVFSPDSKTLATSDTYGDVSVIHLWEVATGKERCHLNDHGSAVIQGGFLGAKHAGLSFSPDGRRLASGHRNTTILIWDVTGRQDRGRLRPVQLSTRVGETLWKDLCSSDAILANQALWSFVAAGDATVAFFKTWLRPAVPKKKTPAETMAQLIADLDHHAFAVRQKARKELSKLGEEAEPNLRKALEQKPSLEVRRAIEQILAPLEKSRKFVVPPPPGELRSLRAIEVLEQIGTREACQLLEEWGRGDPEVRQTEEAYASLRRLRQQGRQ